MDFICPVMCSSSDPPSQIFPRGGKGILSPLDHRQISMEVQQEVGSRSNAHARVFKSRINNVPAPRSEDAADADDTQIEHVGSDEEEAGDALFHVGFKKSSGSSSSSTPHKSTAGFGVRVKVLVSSSRLFTSHQQHIPAGLSPWLSYDCLREICGHC